jgi:hypothetical protein
LQFFNLIQQFLLAFISSGIACNTKMRLRRTQRPYPVEVINVKASWHETVITANGFQASFANRVKHPDPTFSRC